MIVFTKSPTASTIASGSAAATGIGRIAAKALIREDFRITREHGQWFALDGRKALATFHPSALLRDPGHRPDAFMDLREIRKEYRAL